MDTLNNLRILVAEEDPVTQRVLSNMLLYCGHSPAHFADTPEAVLETLSNGGVDLTLLNWTLVADHDFALLKELQEKRISQGMPMMLMVPGMNEEYVNQAARFGFNIFIPKPIPAHLLPEKIQEAVLSTPGWQEARQNGLGSPSAHTAAEEVQEQPATSAQKDAGASLSVVEQPAPVNSNGADGSASPHGIRIPTTPVVEEKAPEFVTNMADPMEAVPMKKDIRQAKKAAHPAVVGGGAQEQSPSKQTPQQEATKKAKALYASGRQALIEKRFKNAAQSFSQALQLCKAFPEAHKGLGLAYRALGDLTRARSCYNKAAQYYVHAGKHQQAAKLYAELCKAGLKPLNPFKIMADHCKTAGKMSKAVQLYELGAQLTPTDPMIAYNLFLLYRRNGQGEKALATVSRLLEATQEMTNPAQRKNLEWAEGVYRKMTGKTYGQPTSEDEEVIDSDASPTILIVDDEPHIRMLLERSLESLEDDGVTLLFAENGEEGLEMIRDKRPELVFLDVMMPKMNGFDVCRTVKRQLGMNEVYIIMLTAKGQEFDRKKGLEAGADVYMTKPFRPQELANLARAVLDL